MKYERFFVDTHTCRTIQTRLSLWERCRAATERADASYILSLVCPDTNWLAFASRAASLFPRHIFLFYSLHAAAFSRALVNVEHGALQHADALRRFKSAGEIAAEHGNRLPRSVI